MDVFKTQAELDPFLKGQRTVVLFHASWCPFCRRFRPAFQDLAAQAQGLAAAEVLLDDERNPLWAEHRINVVPTVVVFDDGKPVHRLDGFAGVGLTEEDLRQGFRAVGALS
jgi:thioredoxin 1